MDITQGIVVMVGTVIAGVAGLTAFLVCLAGLNRDR